MYNNGKLCASRKKSKSDPVISPPISSDPEMIEIPLTDHSVTTLTNSLHNKPPISD